MSAEAEVRQVRQELGRLRAHVPQLAGALVATVDGLVLAEDTAAPPGDAPPPEPESLAALTAAALSVAYQMNEAAGRGTFRELLIHGERGYVATYAAGASAVLTLLADDRLNVGRLHLEGRRCAARVGELATQALASGESARGADARTAADSRTAAAAASSRTGARPPLERRRRNLPSS
ncbi:roadblock/LC7 domain-containing protein [Streptomyces sp. NPDC048172]|uniref:roadblock/LC7 domain-containing protein n=1 Tax=Streptomyces sp. NPDC048172 TaxID=3365505 RepID=UPI0037118719